MMETAGRATYRKTKQGEWVVMAPVDRLTPGAYTVVERRDGSHKGEEIERVGRPFLIDGVEYAYGYIARRSGRSSASSRCTCRCHREAHAGQPGTILYDGCDRCGCEA